MPDLKLFTISDLRDWLINNNPPIGLSEQVIAPVRAWAILNNPFVKDEDAVVSAIYEGDELAAFSACFPDMLDGKRIWWASTLWCNPTYQGKGYGLIVVGSLVEAHEDEVTLDRWGAQETVEIFSCLGYKTIYTSRYILGDKAIDRSSFKGQMAYFAQQLSKVLHRTLYTLHRTPYTLKYSTFVDGEAYAFMQAHRGCDLFLRDQQMLNWILTYPFMQSCILTHEVVKDTIFSANVQSYQYKVVKVYDTDSLVGVYILRENSGVLTILAVYYELVNRDMVFDSIARHIHRMCPKQVETEEKPLMSYLKHSIYFPRMDIRNISFSYPGSFPIVASSMEMDGALQLIDGDCFA